MLSFGKLCNKKSFKYSLRTSTSSTLIQEEEHFAAHNYHPLPVVFDSAKGCIVKDPEGKEYFDFLSAYSAVNQGHCHPDIAKVMIDQLQKLTLSSRAFHNSTFPKYAKFMNKTFGYETLLPMNTGAEAVETSLKLARKWGYLKKGIPQDKAIIITCENNFHGRTLGIISFSTDPDAKANYGPFLPGFMHVPHGDAKALEKVLEEHGKNVCGFLVEPIQGEAGIIIPPEGYYRDIAALCKKHNVLLIDDEIQTGLGRTGHMLAMDHEKVRPDVVLLGKALGGGFLPISAVLSDKQHMLFEPGTHGSTYGGNPLAATVAIESLEVLHREKLCDHAVTLGKHLTQELNKLKETYPFVTHVRGRGLLNAIELDRNHKKSAWDLCLIFKENGLLAKPTHENIIRLAPPLVITKDQLTECIKIIGKSLKQIE
jgi:ornithine--oxo-acid transaminase